MGSTTARVHARENTRPTVEELAERPLTPWDAQAEIAIGNLIDRYLAVCPPPADAKFAISFCSWSAQLVGRGREHLAELIEARDGS
jgi:hypothetical protein